MNSVYGAIGTTILVFMFFYIYLLRNALKKKNSFIISQSMLQYRYSKRKSYARKIKTKTQSKVHYDRNNVRVIILENNAYWIKDNIFYKAPMVDQFIDKDAAEQVDTIHMDKVQLDKMLFIMDKLREGINDDSGSTRDE